MVANLENIYGKRKLETIEKETHANLGSPGTVRDGRHFFSNQVVSRITADSVAWEETVQETELRTGLIPTAFL